MTSRVELYGFRFTGGEHNVYRFSTDDNVDYEIKFVSSTDFFEDPETFGADIFEMIILVVENPNGDHLPADKRVSPTIFAIFDHFFRPQRHAVAYICDSSDGRGEARHRKFGQWFYHNAPPNLMDGGVLTKVDQVLLDGDERTFISLIISNAHPKRKQIVELFMDLNQAGK